MALTDNLVGYYKLDENTGTNVADSSGNSNTGTWQGTLGSQWTTGIINSGGNFNGSDNFISTTTQFSNPAPYSLSLWMKSTSTAGHKLLGFEDSQTGTSGSYDRHIYLDTNGKVVFGNYNGGVVTIISASAYNDGNWHHIVGVSDSSGNMVLYVDGASKGTAATSPPTNYTGYYRIGGYKLNVWPNSSDGYFTGVIDEVGIWSRDLSGAEVTSLYNSGVGISYPFAATTSTSTTTTSTSSSTTTTSTSSSTSTTSTSTSSSTSTTSTSTSTTSTSTSTTSTSSSTSKSTSTSTTTTLPGSPLTVYPSVGAVSPVDGPVNRVSVDESWATIVGAVGNQGGLESVTSASTAGTVASSTTNQFQRLHRSAYSFDTSSLGSSITITSAKFSLVVNFKENVLGSFEVDLVDFSPVSTASIPDTEYVHFGSVPYASVAYADIDSSGSVYTEWNLDANGIANINTIGISSFGLRINWDTDASFGGSWVSGGGSRINAYYADQAGATQDPKLTIEWTGATTSTSTTSTSSSTSSTTSTSKSTSTSTSTTTTSTSSSTSTTTTSTSSSTTRSTSTSVTQSQTTSTSTTSTSSSTSTTSTSSSTSSSTSTTSTSSSTSSTTSRSTSSSTSSSTSTSTTSTSSSTTTTSTSTTSTITSTSTTSSTSTLSATTSTSTTSTSTSTTSTSTTTTLASRFRFSIEKIEQ